MDLHHQAVAAAVKERCHAPESSGPEAVILLDVISRQMFQRRALAPPGVLCARILATLEEWVVATEHDDEAIYDRFLATLANQLSRFELDALSCLDEDCEEFLKQSSICFGINEDCVPELLAQFHKLPDQVRVGVYLGIEESKPFNFLKAEIDAAPDDTPFENPTAALRALNMATLTAMEQG